MYIEQKCEIGEQAYAKAIKYELDYGCCPQCILATVQETVGIVDDARVQQCAHATGTVAKWVVDVVAWSAKPFETTYTAYQAHVI